VFLLAIHNYSHTSTESLCTAAVYVLWILGRDSLRCLALATIDEPRKQTDMNLADPTQFIHFEVCQHCCKMFIDLLGDKNNLNDKISADGLLCGI